VIVDQSISNQMIFQKTHITHQLRVINPHLWHGISDPYLYHIEVELFVDDIKVDERKIPTGLRFFHVDETSFYLNGKPYKLYGVCRHQDREHLGNALSDDMHIEDINLIHEIGANAIRLAHYQQADLIYELCDRMGFVVWAEIPYISRTSTTDLSGNNALSQMEELIKQNYNHSSICMWGIGNEITLRGERVTSNEIYDKLNHLTKTLDPYRLSTIAQLANVSFDDYHNNITDLIGYNLYYGWYVGQAHDLKNWLDDYHKARPKQPVCLSEYGAEGIINIHSENPKPWDYSEEYHAWYHETIYEIIEQTPFIWGSFVWNMFTFASDSRAEGNTKGINNKGLVSHDRKTKKVAFYYYQAKWSKKPMLHLTAKRFKERLNQQIELKVYSNQSHVDFYCNNKFLGKVHSTSGVFKINVKLKKGDNKVKVISNQLMDETIFKY
jgi:beta-galactosidase